MRIQKTLAALCSLFVAQWLTLAAFAVEVTEPAGAAHGYPGFCDINGKKLADSEFRQWAENNRLHVVITHKFSASEVYEEHAQFRLLVLCFCGSPINIRNPGPLIAT
jgi:hypothetical protein